MPSLLLISHGKRNGEGGENIHVRLQVLALDHLSPTSIIVASPTCNVSGCTEIQLGPQLEDLEVIQTTTWEVIQTTTEP